MSTFLPAPFLLFLTQQSTQKAWAADVQTAHLGYINSWFELLKPTSINLLYRK